jgi:hypothetical protein
MRFGAPPSQCQICKRPIQPHDPMTFQEGALLHTRCFDQRTRQGIEAERKAAAALRPGRHTPAERA